VVRSAHNKEHKQHLNPTATMDGTHACFFSDMIMRNTCAAVSHPKAATLVTMV
jgi:hypothetical protein